MVSKHTSPGKVAITVWCSIHSFDSEKKNGMKYDYSRF